MMIKLKKNRKIHNIVNKKLGKRVKECFDNYQVKDEI